MYLYSPRKALINFIEEMQQISPELFPLLLLAGIPVLTLISEVEEIPQGFFVLMPLKKRSLMSSGYLPGIRTI